MMIWAPSPVLVASLSMMDPQLLLELVPGPVGSGARAALSN